MIFPALPPYNTPYPTNDIAPRRSSFDILLITPILPTFALPSIAEQHYELLSHLETAFTKPTGIIELSNPSTPSHSILTCHCPDHKRSFNPTKKPPPQNSAAQPKTYF